MGLSISQSMNLARGDFIIVKPDETSELWTNASFWKSENYLAKMLQRLHPQAQNHVLYPAAANGSACVRQAQSFESSANSADPSVRPLLLYYAFLNWIKAILHIVDLGYPSSATVLQHGVSVRRTKRSGYQLGSEMVYVYKQGILASAVEAGAVRLPQRILVGDVLGMLPHMMSLIEGFYPKYQHVFPIFEADLSEVNVGHHSSVLVPRTLASTAGLTVQEWIEQLLEAAPHELRRKLGPNQTLAQTAANAPNGYLMLPVEVLEHPWVIHQSGLPRLMMNQNALPDWVIHFVILYALSALARYNPLEWADILLWHNEPDALIVEAYLSESPDAIRKSLSHLWNDILRCRQ